MQLSSRATTPAHTHDPARSTATLSKKTLPELLGSHWRFLIALVVAVATVAIWRSMLTYPTTLNDLYTLYYGAKAWWHGDGAYNLALVVPPEHYTQPLYQIGNLYPLVAVLVVLPLTVLPPTAAAVVWLSLLVAGLMIALRLSGWSLWLLLYLPVVNAIYAEQYTLFILVWQILALWAYRTKRPWMLALCCTLILSKPNQGLIFVLALVFLSRYWKQCALVGGLVWGSSILLDPHWIGEWLAMLSRHQGSGQQPIVWWLALFALPLLLVRNYVGAAVLLQFLIMPYPHAAYPLSTTPLGTLGDARYRWLIPISFLWVLVHLLIGEVWASVLTLILPMIVLSLTTTAARQHLVRWKRSLAHAPAELQR